MAEDTDDSQKTEEPTAKKLEDARKKDPAAEVGGEILMPKPTEILGRIAAQKAKQVIWLNPENRVTWGIGDSEMPRYVPYCDVAEECRSINQLYRIVDLIVP